MYEELVKRLKTAAQWADKGLCIPPSLCLEASRAIEELKKRLYVQDITTAQVVDMCIPFFIPKWIPVTERLPERGYYVLVYEDGDILMASYADGNWVLRDMYEVIDDLKPTHWMPLPEPPKE